jgi:dinuclear metal center YbgI/SA1388 family protein
MTVREVVSLLEAWAPRGIAWERDNVGLQVGDARSRARGIVVALDPTIDVMREAVRRGANLVVTHHPLLFRHARSVSTADQAGRCILYCAQHRLSVCAAHTNLDFTRGGTSFALAGALGLQRVAFLARTHKTLSKIVTFVPASHVDTVAAAMARAGAGRIGNYEECSFRTEGTGTFRGSKETRPMIGKAGRFERAFETRLEMIAQRWHVDSIIEAMKAVHPYEEVACDVYPLDTDSDEFGMGIVGELKRPMTLRGFLSHIRRALGTGALRYAGDVNTKVSRVAACGGSGSDLLDEAVRSGADAFVTSDIKYHSFHDAAGRIALIDAGHHETEQPVVASVVTYLRRTLRRAGMSRLAVHAARSSTNPVHYA